MKMKKKRESNILKSSIIVTIIYFLIKVLGLLKQSILASTCGATIESDMFFISSGIISQLAIAIFSALSIVLLTSYSKIDINEGKEKSNKLISMVLKIFIPISIVISIIFCLLAHPLAHLLASSSYSETDIQQLTHYIQIMSIAFIPWCYYLVLNVVLEKNKIFLPGRLQGFFQNCFVFS